MKLSETIRPLFRLAWLLPLLSNLTVGAAELPSDVRINDDGSFRIGEAVFGLLQVAPGGKHYTQKAVTTAHGSTERTPEYFELNGRLPAGGGDCFKLTETLKAISPNAFQADYTLVAANAPVRSSMLALTVEIPAVPGRIIHLDERQFRISKTVGSADLYGQFRLLFLELPERRIRISGHFRVSVNDNRKSGKDTVSLRLMPIVGRNPVDKCELRAKIDLFKPFFTEPIIQNVSTDNAGNLRIGNTVLQYVNYMPGWRPSYLTAGTLEPDENSPERTVDGILRHSGRWSGLRYSGTITPRGNNAIQVHTLLTAEPPVATEAVALICNIPTKNPGKLLVDGQEVRLPEKFEQVRLIDWRRTGSLQFESDGRRISLEGNFKLMIVDDRKWGKNFFVVRLCPETVTTPLSRAEWKYTVRIDGPQTEPLDLRPLFNMGLSDPVAGDGRGGWTDRGPKNDLRKLAAGQFFAAGAGFEIVDEDKACLVLSGTGVPFPPRSAAVKIPETGGVSSFLYLLHAAEFPEKRLKTVGRIVAEYSDGSHRSFPVACGDWRAPVKTENAAVAWTAETQVSYIGFYLSQFPVGKPIRLRFEAAPSLGNGKWMILAASGGDRELNLADIRTPFYRVAGKDWIPLKFNGKVQADSPLDFSKFTDAPAGQYGPVVISPTGHFVFRDAPKRRIRFFGPNLVGSANFLERKLADDFVEKATRLGYNSVRFHHFENGLLATDSADSLTFNPQRLDQFDYLFAELKKRGIYSCLDLFASRKLRPGDRIAEYGGKVPNTFFETKGLIPVSPSAMANWKEFARRLLNHRNPYTGLRYAEEPALYGVNLINEGPLMFVWNRSPVLIAIYEKKYVEFLQYKGLDTPENRENREGLFHEFLNEIQSRSIREQIAFLRNELKTGVPVTDMNTGNQYSLIQPRSTLDYVDLHFYWNHPRFVRESWRLPFLFSNRSLIGENVLNLRNSMPPRIFGKPYTITEFNLCTPDPFRTECGPLVGGYAALQDWDGLHRFAWSHSNSAIRTMAVPTGFDIVNDPQAQLAERIIHMLFVRGDVRAAEHAFAFRCTPEDLRKQPNGGEVPEEFSMLGLYARIGSLPIGGSLSGVTAINPFLRNWREKLPPGSHGELEAALHGKMVKSDTGEIQLAATQKSMTIVTPRSEVFAFLESASGKIASFKGDGSPLTAALLSLDGLPLDKSRKILLLHLTDIAGSRQKFIDEQCLQLESWGTLPLLVKRSRMEVSLNLPEAMKVEALRLDGSSAATVKADYRDGALHFKADTAARPEGVMAYLLSR
ncbi:hypothetical protein [Victivallis vadensis]|uniref:hypothetical protein n=1 Tax=Victivallis vadensis TaxID=172901 RepID=UPI003AF89FD4